MEHVDGPTGISTTGISVTGTGRVAVAPELATLTVGVSIEDTNLDAARAAASVKTTAARDHLLASGVAERDIQTTRLNVRSSKDHQRRRQIFYISTGLTAVIRDLASAESTVNELVSAVGDGLEMHGLAFGVEDPDKGRDEALTLAFEDARHKAQLLAELAGASLGPVLAISQTAGRAQGPRPMGRQLMAMGAESSDIPIEGGELEMLATVDVRWALDG